MRHLSFLRRDIIHEKRLRVPPQDFLEGISRWFELQYPALLVVPDPPNTIILLSGEYIDEGCPDLFWHICCDDVSIRINNSRYWFEDPLFFTKISAIVDPIVKCI